MSAGDTTRNVFQLLANIDGSERQRHDGRAQALMQVERTVECGRLGWAPASQNVGTNAVATTG